MAQLVQQAYVCSRCRHPADAHEEGDASQAPPGLRLRFSCGAKNCGCQAYTGTLWESRA